MPLAAQGSRYLINPVSVMSYGKCLMLICASEGCPALRMWDWIRKRHWFCWTVFIPQSSSAIFWREKSVGGRDRSPILFCFEKLSCSLLITLEAAFRCPPLEIRWSTKVCWRMGSERAHPAPHGASLCRCFVGVLFLL